MGGSSMDLFEVFFASQLIFREASHCLSKESVRLGLSILELQALWIAAGSQQMTMAEMAMVSGYSKAELKPAVEALETDGLVLKILSHDSRLFSWAVTEEGRALVERIPVCEGRVPSCLLADPEAVKDFIQAARGLIITLRGHEIADMFGQGNTEQ